MTDAIINIYRDKGLVEYEREDGSRYNKPVHKLSEGEKGDARDHLNARSPIAKIPKSLESSEAKVNEIPKAFRGSGVRSPGFEYFPIALTGKQMEYDEGSNAGAQVPIKGNPWNPNDTNTPHPSTEDIDAMARDLKDDPSKFTEGGGESGSNPQSVAGVPSTGGAYGGYGKFQEQYDDLDKESKVQMAGKQNELWDIDDDRYFEKQEEAKVLRAAKEREAAINKELAAWEPKPIGMWTNKDAGQRVMGGIAIMMGALGDALMQQGGLKGQGNQALNIVMDGVDKEVSRQTEIGEDLKFKATQAYQNVESLEKLGLRKDQVYLSLKQNKLNEVSVYLNGIASRRKGVGDSAQLKFMQEKIDLERRRIGAMLAKSLVGPRRTATDKKVGRGAALAANALKAYMGMHGNAPGDWESSWAARKFEDWLPNQMTTVKDQRSRNFWRNIAKGLAMAEGRGFILKKNVDDEVDLIAPLPGDGDQTVKDKVALVGKRLRKAMEDSDTGSATGMEDLDRSME